MNILKCLQCNVNIDLHFKFCPGCGTQLDVLQSHITFCFLSGFKYNAIVKFVKKYLGITISLRSLKYKLKLYGLKRKEVIFNQAELEHRIRQKLDSSNCLIGYRMMQNLLKLDGFLVPRRIVAEFLKRLDPVGCELRTAHRLRRRVYRSLGPNDCWHIDGYDKLKPYGFALHGCIDGFSRHILWLKVLKSNNDPVVIAKLYLMTVSTIGACPKKIRTDYGTENGIVAAAQCFFVNDLSAHIYGTSHHNQRIESWWSFLRKSKTHWWMNFFKDMIEANLFTPGNEFQTECLWYCFSAILQQEIDEVVESWNTHYIRKSRHDTTPGIPSELFLLPEMHSFQDCKIDVNVQKMQEVEAHLLQMQTVENDSNYLAYFHHVTSILGISHPQTYRECLLLYRELLTRAQLQ